MRRRSRRRLIVAALAAIGLGVALWFAVVLLTDAGTTQVYSIQRVSSLGSPGPSLSPTAMATATLTRVSTNQGSPSPLGGTVEIIIAVIVGIGGIITFVGLILNNFGTGSGGIVAFLTYRDHKAKEKKDEEDIDRKGYIDNFCTSLKTAREAFILEEITSNASTNPASEDVYMDWEQDYIALRATDRARSDCQQKSDIHEIIQREQKMPAFNFSVAVHEDTRVGELTKILKGDKKRLVLLGGPGAGKTTYLKKITLNFLKEKNLAARPFEPIYVECKEFAAFSQRRSMMHHIHKKSDELYRFIAFVWAKNHEFPEKSALAYIRQKVKENKALFLLDGLDEIPLDGDDKQATINYNQHFKDLISNIPKAASIIVTLRGSLDPELGQSGYADLPGFSTLALEDFTPKDMGAFVEKQKKKEPNQSISNGTTRIERLKTLLGSTPRLQAFTATPLLLHLITVSTKKIIQPLPASRIDIYRCCVNNLFHRWNKKENIYFSEKREMLTGKQQREVLGHLAWYLHCKKHYRCNWDDMWDEIQKCLPVPASFTSISMLEKCVFVDLRLRSGFIKEDREKKNYYRFTNITMQEYFAAQYLIEQERKMPSGGSGQPWWKDEMLNDPWWEEVILVYIKYAGKDASQLLKILAALNQRWSSSSLNKEFYARLLLAGRSLVWDTKKQPVLTQSAVPPTVVPTLAASTAVVTPTITSASDATTFDEIRMRLYCLLLSPIPMFVQEKVALVFAEMEQEDIQKHELERLALLKFPNEDYAAFRGRLKNLLEISESVSPLMLRALEYPLSDADRQYITSYKTLQNSEWRALFADPKRRVAATVGVRMVYALMIYRFSAEKKLAIASMLSELLSDSQIDIKTRDCMARALGVFGDQGLTEKLRLLLKDTNIPLSIRWNIVTALGEIAKYTLTNPVPSSITATLLLCLNGDNTEFYVQDEYLRWNIATTLIHTLLYQDIEYILNRPRPPFKDDIVRHGYRALSNDDYAASEIDELLRSLSTLAQTTSVQATSVQKTTFKDQYTCTCQMLEKLELTTDKVVGSLEKIKEDVKAAFSASDPELVENLSESFSHLEWTIMKRKYMCNITD